MMIISYMLSLFYFSKLLNLRHKCLGNKKEKKETQERAETQIQDMVNINYNYILHITL